MEGAGSSSEEVGKSDGSTSGQSGVHVSDQTMAGPTGGEGEGVCEGSTVHEPLPRKKKRKTDGGKRSLSLCHAADINDHYMEQGFKECMKSALGDGIEATHIGTEALVVNNPFTCCVLPNFVKDEDFMKGLREELLDLNFNHKSNDLYKFQQSDALQNVTSPHITALKKLLYEDFLSWLREVTGIPFNDTYDLTCSKYNYTDVLLCHDDELEGRRVAFILYLVPPWQTEDGGLLDLFDVDEHGQPQKIVKSLVPKWNNFVFFEVTPKSFHQVSEVVNPDKCRLSISGWFHGPTVPRPPPYIEPRSDLSPYLDTEETTFYNWMNEKYMDPGNQGDVQEKFSDESEIQLIQFLESEGYELLLDLFKSPDIQWEGKGPANKRHYEVADMTTLPALIQECLSVMQSEHMFLLLSNFTGLPLHEQAPYSSDEEVDDASYDSDVDVDHSVEPHLQTVEEEEHEGKMSGNIEGKGSEDGRIEGNGEGKESGCKETGNTANREDGTQKAVDQPERRNGEHNNHHQDTEGSPVMKGQRKKAVAKVRNPRCRAEVRKWTHGCYTLLHDTDTEGSEFALDASIFFNTQGLNQECGGFMSYIAKDEDEELLSVVPEDNALSLVYRDKETLRFVKHINHSFTQCWGCSCTAEKQQHAFYEIYLVYYE